MKHHALVLLDRGLEHVHRWKPSCSCGWVGVQRRRKQEAVKIHRSHVAGVRRRQLPLVAPRRPTPVDQLPEALRVTH